MPQIMICVPALYKGLDLTRDLQEAYGILNDPDKRREFDLGGSDPSKGLFEVSNNSISCSDASSFPCKLK